MPNVLVAFAYCVARFLQVALLSVKIYHREQNHHHEHRDDDDASDEHIRLFLQDVIPVGFDYGKNLAHFNLPLSCAVEVSVIKRMLYVACGALHITVLVEQFGEASERRRLLCRRHHVVCRGIGEILHSVLLLIVFPCHPSYARGHDSSCVHIEPALLEHRHESPAALVIFVFLHLLLSYGIHPFRGVGLEDGKQGVGIAATAFQIFFVVRLGVVVIRDVVVEPCGYGVVYLLVFCRSVFCIHPLHFVECLLVEAC